MADKSNKFPKVGLSDDGEEPEVAEVTNAELKEMLDDLTGKINALTDMVAEVKKGQTTSGDALQTLRKDIEDHVVAPSSSSGDSKKTAKSKSDGPFNLEFSINQFKPKKDGIDLNGPTVSKALFLISRFAQLGYPQAPEALGDVLEWCFYADPKIGKRDYKAIAETHLQEMKAKNAPAEDLSKGQDAVYSVISIREKADAMTTALKEVSTIKETNPTAGVVKEALQKIKDALGNNIQPYTQVFIRNLGSLFQHVSGSPKIGSLTTRNQPVKVKFKDTFLCAAWVQRINREKQAMFEKALLNPELVVPSVEKFLQELTEKSKK